MLRTCKVPILAFTVLALCVLAFPAAALADDAGLATSLVGKWEGQWEKPDTRVKGNLTVKITAAKGNTVDGEMTWFGTSAGDVPDHFAGARLKGRQIKAYGDVMDFTVTVSDDGTSMEGRWSNHAQWGPGAGPIRLKKVE